MAYCGWNAVGGDRVCGRWTRKCCSTTLATVAAGRIWWTEPGGDAGVEASVCWCWAKKRGRASPESCCDGCLGNYRRLTQRSADAQTENRRKRSEKHCTHAAEAVTSFLDRPESQKNIKKKQKEGKEEHMSKISKYKKIFQCWGKKSAKFIITGKKVHFCIKRIILKCWN